MSPIKITAFLATTLAFASPAMADPVFKRGNCQVFVDDEISLSISSLEANMALKVGDQYPRYLYKPLCDRIPDGRFLVERHPEADAGSALKYSSKSGGESRILYATAISSGCQFEIEYWQEGDQHINNISWQPSCLDKASSQGWRVDYKVPSDTGISYSLICGSGKRVAIEYSPALDPKPYFAALGSTFETLEEAASFKCD